MIAQSWYTLIAGSVRGPLDARTLKSMADKGQLNPSDQVRRGDDGHWVPARQVSGLFNGSPDDEDDAPELRPIESPSRAAPVERGERPSGVSLRTATLVAIVSIILALVLDLVVFLRIGFRYGFDDLLSGYGFLMLLDHLKISVGFGGLLFFLFILRAKQSR